MLNNQLIKLISSLTKSEKRYFKINSSINKTNKTLIRMFDLIEKNKIYSSAKTLKVLNISSKANLAVIETRLQSLILKHLRGFHSNNSQTIELNNLLIEVEILYNKRLFKNCEKLLLKAEKIATEHEHHLALLSILKWESYIAKEQGKYLKQSQEKLKTILSKEEQLLSNYNRLANFKHHSFNLLLLSKNIILSKNNKELKSYDKLTEENYFEIKDDFSFDEKIYLLNFKGRYYVSKGKIKECLLQFENLIIEIEDSNRKNILFSNEYFFGLNNLLLLQVMNKNFDDYNETLKKIYEQFDGIDTFKPLLFNLTQCYELGIYCEIGETKKGLALIPNIEKKLKLYESETNEINKLLFYLNIAIIYFFDANYKKSIYWLNIFLNDYSVKKNDVSSNVYYYGHIINLIIHFEAKNYSPINYLHNECINNIQKIRKINHFDKAVLTFIKKYSNNPVSSKNDRLLVFKALEQDLKEITKDPEETISLHFFDFYAWIDSHILSKPIDELIKAKNLS